MANQRFDWLNRLGHSGFNCTFRNLSRIWLEYYAGWNMKGCIYISLYIFYLSFFKFAFWLQSVQLARKNVSNLYVGNITQTDQQFLIDFFKDSRC